jgi:hypothetical protein
LNLGAGKDAGRGREGRKDGGARIIFVAGPRGLAKID